MVCDLLMNTIDELRREIEVTKRGSEATINELRQQMVQLQEKLEAKNRADVSLLTAENQTLKGWLKTKSAELEKLREKVSNCETKCVQTNEIIDFAEMKESQFMETLSEFEWVEKLLMENIADSERICAALSAKDAEKKCVDI